MESFPYVRAFQSYDGFGIHFLASMKPLSHHLSSVLAARMPNAAVLTLWNGVRNQQPTTVRCSPLGRAMLDKIVAEHLKHRHCEMTSRSTSTICFEVGFILQMTSLFAIRCILSGRTTPAFANRFLCPHSTAHLMKSRNEPRPGSIRIAGGFGGAATRVEIEHKAETAAFPTWNGRRYVLLDLFVLLHCPWGRLGYLVPSVAEAT